MADVVVRVREGMTADLVFQILQADGTPVNLATAARVGITLAAGDGNGKSYTWLSDDPSPKIRVTDAANGKVALTPDLLKASESPYRGYLRRYLTTATWEPAPSDGDLVIEVLPSYTG